MKLKGARPKIYGGKIHRLYHRKTESVKLRCTLLYVQPQRGGHRRRLYTARLPTNGGVDLRLAVLLFNAHIQPGIKTYLSSLNFFFFFYIGEGYFHVVHVMSCNDFGQSWKRMKIISRPLPLIIFHIESRCREDDSTNCCFIFSPFLYYIINRGVHIYFTLSWWYLKLCVFFNIFFYFHFFILVLLLVWILGMVRWKSMRNDVFRWRVRKTKNT